MQNAPYPWREVDQGTNLRQLMAIWQEKNADKLAFRYQEVGEEEIVEISYPRFAEDICALGTAFLNLGLQGAKIAVVGDNSYDWIVTYFAATNSGNIIVPLDRDLNTVEIGYLLQRSGCKAIVSTAKYNGLLDEIEPTLPDLEHRLLVGPGESLRALMEKGRELYQKGDTAFANVVLDDDALTALLFTSGTTGVAKGVMLSHRNLTSDVIASIMSVELWGTTVLVLPLHHSFAFTTSVLCALHSGTTICINKTLKDLSPDLQLFKPDYLFLVPVIVSALHRRILQAMRKAGREAWLTKVMEHSDALVALGVDLRRVIFKSILDNFGGQLKLVISGGAALDAALVAQYYSFGIDLREGYGTTECSPVLAVNRNYYHKPGTIGPALPLVEIMINDPDDQGEGEICVKGDMVMQGYYGDAEATAEAFINGWYRTGDIGKLDEDGFYSITGRAKNVIILSNGKNVYPEEMEMQVQGLPGVREVVVYDENDLIVVEIFPDEEYLQENPGVDIKVQLQQGIDAINEKLPRHKKMADLRIRDQEFEKTGSGKIRRTAIRRLK
ncbi:MAG: AMP-binding protein [Symbiobacteriaceae bacterium]|nr:AMP-binding protein [Symbiobacteriaceae bacterium]